MCLCLCVCASVCLCVCVLWISVFVFGAVETKAQAASADTFKHRLEQLDDLEEVRMCACAHVHDCVRVSLCTCVLHVCTCHVCVSSLYTHYTQLYCMCCVISCAPFARPTPMTLAAVCQAVGGHCSDPVLPQQVCAQHGHPGQLWSVILTAADAHPNQRCCILHLIMPALQ